MAEVKRLDNVGLCIAQEGRELCQVYAVLAVVVVRVAADPACAVGGWWLVDHARLRRITRMTGQRRADQMFKAAFGGVGGHTWTHVFRLSIQPLSDSTVTASLIWRRENCFFRSFQA